MTRYEIQSGDGIGGYRITDLKDDSRVATCYDPDNARIVVAAMNHKCPPATPSAVSTEPEISDEDLQDMVDDPEGYSFEHVPRLAAALLHARAQLRAAAVQSNEDSATVDWIEAHTKGDTIICPPGEHGGELTHWLVSQQVARDKYGSICDEHEGPTLREAFRAARHASQGDTK